MEHINPETETPKLIYNHFWCITPKGEVKIHHQGLIEFFKDRGFCWLSSNENIQLIRKQGQIIATATILDITNLAYKFIESTEVSDNLGNGATRRDLLNLFVRGIDNYINQAKLRLLPIVDLQQHRDTIDSSYFYCTNGVVRITASTISMLDYGSIDGYVWKDQIKNHVFDPLGSDEPLGDFATFSLRICDENPDKFKSLQSVIGYMLHRYWVASTPVIPCLLDETVVGDEEAQGGTGKTLLCQGLSYIRTMVDVDGKNFSSGSNFAFQRVSEKTELLFVDDLPRSAVFEDWFSIVATGLEVNKKNKPSFKIAREYSPKIILTSNFPIRSVAGYSTERRKLELEIGTHYGPNCKPVDEFGGEFFQSWDAPEFNKMLNFFARCIQLYLRDGLIQPPSVNADLRKLITDLGSEDLLHFLNEKTHARSVQRFHKSDLYDEFLKNNPGQRKYYTSQNRFILKVHKYFALHRVTFRETPAATKKIIEITDWGDIPVSDVVEETNQTTTESIATTPHNYITVDTSTDET